MPIRIPWICETCGAFGEVDSELSTANLDRLTLEDAANATFGALLNLAHPHPVRPGC